MQELTAGSVAIDPITLEVIRHRLVSITNQIDANIKRTAFSPYIYEYNDFAVGLVGAENSLKFLAEVDQKDAARPLLHPPP